TQPGVAPWLPLNSDRTSRNVADQREDDDSMLSLYRRLLRAPRDHSALQVGRLDLVPGAPPGSIAWLRSDGDQRILVAANLSDDVVVVPTGEGGAELLVATDAGIRL